MNSTALFLPLHENRPEGRIFSVHQNTASCVLRHSKFEWCLKTTCPAGGWKTLPKSGFLITLKNEIL